MTSVLEARIRLREYQTEGSQVDEQASMRMAFLIEHDWKTEQRAKQTVASSHVAKNLTSADLLRPFSRNLLQGMILSNPAGAQMVDTLNWVLRENRFACREARVHRHKLRL
jgi:hypothetical protein